MTDEGLQGNEGLPGDERQQGDEDATSVNRPSSTPPDEGKAYDPAMTDTDEANIPPETEADPHAG